ncbi:hypothetical protein C0583_04845 [Candidatus Parcubacteria bacterium]|nr:MAG: hypothetical protein C0583_04845 [Candidatus Parcubacteria bacterium]
MSKKIKKQIKRSMPVFVITCLLVSTLTAGLVFNLDFNLVKNTDNEISLEMNLHEAKADVATTTVTVKNAPPNIDVDVAEDPASASTTPINVCNKAEWTVTASDPELNNYYLIICATDSATPNNGGAPTCGGGAGNTFCVSGATVSGSQATCVDAAMADPGAEFDDWYGFVCDNHATEAACQDSSQGSGDPGSPIYINHAPDYTAVITSDDNKDPGGTFTVTASVTDGDVQGGADVLILDVCATNSWATSTGCEGGSWCTGTSTSADVSCSFATSTPAVDDTYSYYAFIKDWHEMPAPVNGRTANYTVNNVAPIVSNVVINGGAPIEIEMKGVASTTASSSADIYDANSCLDIVDATSSIYISDALLAPGGLNCSADNNYCYQMETTDCVVSGCSGSSFTTAQVLCTVEISYYATPTDNFGTNPQDGDNWLAGVTGIDDDGLKGASTSVSGVELISLEALDIQEDEIPYGSIRGGQNSGDANATTTVENYGNVPINTQVEGLPMWDNTDTYWITDANQEFDLNNFTYGLGSYTLSSTTPDTLNTVTPKPTSFTGVSDEIFWGINIPGGTPSGDYDGLNTFTAVLDDLDW